MLNIAYCCDNNYIPYVGVAMISCIENNLDDFDKIVFHVVVDKNVTQKSKSKLKENIARYPDCEIKFYLFDPKVNIAESDYHPIVNAVLYVPGLIDADRIIFMDADTLVLDSFKELYDMDLEDNYCGAIYDVIPPYFKEKIGFKKEDKYFNSGFILMDLEKMRGDDVGEKFLEELTKQYKYPDQDIINIVLQDRIMTLSPKYNFHGYFLEWKYENVLKVYSMDYDYYYSKETIDGARENIVCTHFLNFFSAVPWKDETNPMYPKFRENVDKSVFTNEEVFIPRQSSFFKDTIYGLFRRFQNPLFVSFAKFYLTRLFKNK